MPSLDFEAGIPAVKQVHAHTLYRTAKLGSSYQYTTSNRPFSFQNNFTFVMLSVIITNQEAQWIAILIAVRTLNVSLRCSIR